MLTRRAALIGLSVGLTSFATSGRAQRRPTPSADIGPFYPIVRGRDEDGDLTLVRGGRGRAAGDVIEVSGRVIDIRGNAVSRARIELWQANAAGRYAHRGDTSSASRPELSGLRQARNRTRWKLPVYDHQTGRLR